ncbi:MAG: hypothetical protein K6B46_02670 [Opitutales bacterium]|nr:hypothetical protein [Opitutales bacterium]
MSEDLAPGLKERVYDAPRRRFLRVLAIGVIFVLCGFFLLAGLAKRQLFQSENYLRQHNQQSRRIVMTPAPRGEIRDRYGRVLVSNKARFSAVIDLSLIRDEIENERIKIIRNSRQQVRAGTRSGFDRNSALNDARIEILQRYLKQVNEAIGREQVLDSKKLLRHINQRRTLDFPLAENLTDSERARFVENFPVDSPVRLYVDSVRKYPYGKAAAHVLGYLQNFDDIQTDGIPEKYSSLPVAYYPGKKAATGLERRFDDVLSGIPGYQVWMVHPNGFLFKMIDEKLPEQGSFINTTIDIDLQQDLERALGESPFCGSAALVDVNTGEVLAMASSRSYDPSEYSYIIREKYQKELKAQDKNFQINRVVQGRYPPGSTFKLITACAALRSGIAPERQFDCGAFVTIGKKRFVEHDGIAFGKVDLARMLRVSSNVYCYNIGLEIGQEPIVAEARRFGLDRGLSLELPEAGATGFAISSPKYKRDNGYSGWSTGDTMNLVIGQGYTLTSPMHIVCLAASIARKETRTNLTILRNPGRTADAVSAGGEPLGLSDEAYAELIRGMRECVAAGTGKRARVEGLEIAGKTGTAQWTNEGKKWNLAWFAGFAPIENPKVAVVVCMEAPLTAHAGGGATAGPIAGKIFKAWFERQGKSENARP